MAQFGSEIVSTFQDLRLMEDDLRAQLKADPGFREILEARLNRVVGNRLALEAMPHCSTREEALKYLPREPHLTRQATLTSWAWLKERAAAIDSGRRFDSRFLSEVGSRDGRQNLDREFSSLLFFLPLLDSATDGQSLFYEYSDAQGAPDFKIEIGADAIVGLELTEAAPSEEWHKDQKLLDEFLAKVETLLEGCTGKVVIEERPPASELRGHEEEVASWLRNVLAGNEKPIRRNVFRHQDLGLGVRVSVFGQLLLWVMGFDPGFQSFLVGQDLENRAAKAMREAAKKKQTQRVTREEPCALAIQLSESLRREKLASLQTLLQRELDALGLKQFAELWVFTLEHAVKLR